MGYIGKATVGGVTNLIGSTLYGTCSTAAETAAKIVNCTDFNVLMTGVTIHVKFTYTNTATNPTLNVNGTGAKAIYRFGTTRPGAYPAASWIAGEVVSFTYDGTNWMMNDDFGDFSGVQGADMTGWIKISDGGIGTLKNTYNVSRYISNYGVCNLAYYSLLNMNLNIKNNYFVNQTFLKNYNIPLTKFKKIVIKPGANIKYLHPKEYLQAYNLNNHSQNFNLALLNNFYNHYISFKKTFDNRYVLDTFGAYNLSFMTYEYLGSAGTAVSRYFFETITPAIDISVNDMAIKFGYFYPKYNTDIPDGELAINSSGIINYNRNTYRDCAAANNNILYQIAHNLNNKVDMNVGNFIGEVWGSLY